MKFPLAEAPFPPLQLSGNQCYEFENMMNNLLEDTVDEYDDYVIRNNRTINKKRWKEIKSRENVAVYKKVDNVEFAFGRVPLYSTASAILEPSSAAEAAHVLGSSEWKLPKMIAVGRVVGTLEDAMFGIYAPDADTLKVKTSYIDDELVDGRVLYQIHHATDEEPFRFLGLKWLVKVSVPQLGSIVRPRDLLFMEASGVRVLPNGERLGYFNTHSVDMPQCPELRELGIIRSRFSMCYLFKQMPNNEVEIFMRAFVEPRGRITETIATISAANALVSCWKLSWCAQNKKLAALMREANAMRSSHSQKGHSRAPYGSKNCTLCTKNASGFRSLASCELCLAKVCKRCVIARKISYVRRAGDLLQIPTRFCKNCITRAVKVNSADIAVLDHVVRSGRRRQTGGTEESSATDSGPRQRAQSARRPGDYLTPTRVRDSDTLGSDEVPIETVDEWEQNQHEQFADLSSYASTPRSVDGGAPGQPENPQVLLWRQMEQLRLAVEETYLQTKRNGLILNNAMRDS